MDTLQFLQRVWTDRQAWVDIPSKVNGHWIPASIEWPDPEYAAARVASALADEEDIYFSPAMFSSRGRRYEDVLPTYWLWADLDEVTPEQCVEHGLTPTIAWSSSPNRYQALWELDHPCSPVGIERLNRHVTYALGADRSGWDLTQVLRLPGTRNFKYPDGPTVELVITTDEIYNPKALAKRLKKMQPLAPPVQNGQGAIDSQTTANRGSPVVPPAAKSLLRAKEGSVVEGERSHQLWKLERLLLEAGFNEEQVYDLVVETPWNKHKEVQSGERQLRREIAKAARLGPQLREVPERRPVPSQAAGSTSSSAAQLPAGEAVRAGVGRTEDGASRQHDGDRQVVVPENVETEAAATLAASPFVGYGDFLSANLEAPRWLIEELWTAKSHGIVGGEPKSLKSVLSVAMGMSVASGKPFLMDKHFPVGTRGPVLIVQEENDPWRMQDLLRKLAWYYGLIRDREVEVEKLSGPKAVGAVADRVARLAFPKEIPLKILNNYGFDMTDEDHRQMLEEEIREIHPALVILDPLYLMVGGADVDKHTQMGPFFKWLIYLKFTYGCAVLLNHHFRKASGAGGPRVRPGQRVLGTTTFHAWVASAAYVENTTDELSRKNEVKLKVEREFRNVGPRRPLSVRLMMGDPGELAFEAEVVRFDVVGQLEEVIRADPGITALQAAEILEVDKRTVLSRARGAPDRIKLEGGKAGRGKSWRLYLADREGGEAE